MNLNEEDFIEIKNHLKCFKKELKVLYIGNYSVWEKSYYNDAYYNFKLTVDEFYKIFKENESENKNDPIDPSNPINHTTSSIILKKRLEGIYNLLLFYRKKLNLDSFFNPIKIHMSMPINKLEQQDFKYFKLIKFNIPNQPYYKEIDLSEYKIILVSPKMFYRYPHGMSIINELHITAVYRSHSVGKRYWCDDEYKSFLNLVSKYRYKVLIVTISEFNHRLHAMSVSLLSNKNPILLSSDDESPYEYLYSKSKYYYTPEDILFYTCANIEYTKSILNNNLRFLRNSQKNTLKKEYMIELDDDQKYRFYNHISKQEHKDEYNKCFNLSLQKSIFDN